MFLHHRKALTTILLILLLPVSIGMVPLAKAQTASLEAENRSDESSRWGTSSLTADTWTQMAKLTASDGDSGDAFGVSVAVSGTTVVVGAQAGADGQGLAYVFEKPEDGWTDMTETAKLTASDGEVDDFFGGSVSVSGTIIVVGARGKDDGQGSVYVFEKPEGGWADMTETAKLTASDAEANDRFGAVAVSQDTIVVGASGDDDNQGSTYIFEKPEGSWADMTETAKLNSSDGETGDEFGGSVIMKGDTVFVGAAGDNNGQGAAYVFDEPEGGWTDGTETAKLTASDSVGNVQGVAYVFEEPEGGWTDMTETAKLTASDGTVGDHFGRSGAASEDTVVVGAQADDVSDNDSQGSAYVFEKPEGGWVDGTETAKLTASDGAASDSFGASVAVSEDTVVVGASGDDNGQGSAYVFNLLEAPTFADVSHDHPHYEYIEALWDGGFTAGCSTDPLEFCPDQIMNRAMSAVFMLRGSFGKDYSPPAEPWDSFADDWSDISWAEKWAEGMWENDLTAGCQTDPLMYCPQRELSRVEASVFGLRMMHGVEYQPPEADGNLLADMTDPNYWGTKWAEQAYRDGLLPDCGTQDGKPLFCPDDLVDRSLGAYLIVQAKDLPH